MSDQFLTIAQMQANLDRWRHDPLVRLLVESIKTRFESRTKRLWSMPRDEQQQYLAELAEFNRQLNKLEEKIKESEFTDCPENYLARPFIKGSLQPGAGLGWIIWANDKIDFFAAREQVVKAPKTRAKGKIDPVAQDFAKQVLRDNQKANGAQLTITEVANRVRAEIARAGPDYSPGHLRKAVSPIVKKFYSTHP